MQNVVGLTLVAMATIFGLGAEIQSSTGLLVSLFVDLLGHHHHHYPRFYVHLQKLEQQTLQLKTVIKTPRIKMF